MKSRNDSTKFLSDPQVKTFIFNDRQDLKAPDVTLIGVGKFVVLTVRPSASEVVIIKSIMPYAMERRSIGTAQEDFAMIDPSEGNGCFAFTPQVSRNSPGIINANLNAPRKAGGTLLNANRSAGQWLTDISAQPYVDMMKTIDNPFLSIEVPGGSEFTLVFSLVPVGSVTPIPNPYAIGTGVKRVDFAGAYIGGVTMPLSLYGQLVREREDQK